MATNFCSTKFFCLLRAAKLRYRPLERTQLCHPPVNGYVRIRNGINPYNGQCFRSVVCRVSVERNSTTVSAESVISNAQESVVEGKSDAKPQRRKRASKIAKTEEKIDLAEEELPEEFGLPAVNPFDQSGPSHCVVGIDPDVGGALAIIRNCDQSEGGVTVEIHDVPCVQITVGKRSRRRHDAVSICKILKDLNAPKDTVAFVEYCSPFPGDGKMSWYGAGFGYGVWVGALSAHGFQVVPVTSRRWKIDLKISGKQFGKDDGRFLATSFFPSIASLLKRKKDHGRAEALLIAAWGKGYRPTVDLNTTTEENLIRSDKENAYNKE